MNAICVHCGHNFEAKEKGYNAKYCSNKCKRRNQRERLKAKNPEAFKVRRKRDYGLIKSNPKRLKNHQTNANKSRRKVSEWLFAYKLAQGCVDCGYNKHYSALQLDHEGPKAVSISEARSSIKRLQAEILSGQCRVRCANCHSIKTWERKQIK